MLLTTDMPTKDQEIKQADFVKVFIGNSEFLIEEAFGKLKITKSDKNTILNHVIKINPSCSNQIYLE